MSNKLEYIQQVLNDAKVREALGKVVENVDMLMPACEEEFADVQKIGLYPAEQCVAFVTKQGHLFISWIIWQW